MQSTIFFLIILFSSSMLISAQEENHNQERWTHVSSLEELAQFANNHLVAFKGFNFWHNYGKVFDNRLHQKNGIYFGAVNYYRSRSYLQQGYYLTRVSSLDQQEFETTKLIRLEHLASITLLMRKATHQEYEEIRDLLQQKIELESKKHSNTHIQLPEIFAPE